MKHPYRPECSCARCTREGARRQRQRNDRPIATVMLDWANSRNRKRARVSREWFDAFEDGRPMSDDDR